MIGSGDSVSATASIGDYFICAGGVGGSTMNINTSGVTVIFNEFYSYGGNSCTRLMVLQATSTSIRVSRASVGTVLLAKIN